MKTTIKWQLILGLAIATGIPGSAQAAASSPTQKPSFTIHVRNFAHFDAQSLEQAAEVVSRVFDKAGVVSHWVDEPVQASSADPLWVGPSHVWVNILPAAMADRLDIAGDVAGLAPGAGPHRTLVYVLYNRVLEMQRKQVSAIVRRDALFCTTIGQLLGTVMAHEIGHVLLDLPVHSETGIMRGIWDLAVMRDILGSRVYFTKKQAELIQADVASRAEQPNTVVVDSPHS